MSTERREGRGVGLAPKLLSITLLVAALVAGALSTLASGQYGRSMVADFESKGEAIALSLAATAEQSVGASLATLQGSVDSNKVIAGVKYIYVEDSDGAIQVHTFTPTFPRGLEKTNHLEMGELSQGKRVKVATDVTFDLGGGARLRVVDVAAPVAGGALGTVHVGMDRDAIEAEVASLRGTLLASGAGVALVGAALGLVFTLLVVVRPIRRLTAVTEEIVRSGDLTQQVASSSSDEIGQLARTFARMVEKLREIPTTLTLSTDQLEDAVRLLGGSTGEQEKFVNRQAAALQETQVTAQEIKQTSAVVTEKAEGVLNVVRRADEISRAGEAAVEQGVTGLTDIRAQTEEIAQRVSELGLRTRQISGITETVKDLADQSNMLALNAAIEAVRSGEHGKGFAVVAREIRSLADQSIQATNRVREILDDIGGAIGGAVAITEKGKEKMERSLQLVRSSGDNLRELSGIVKETSSAVRQIAAAVGQQNAGIAQIFTAVSDQSRMMSETVGSLEETRRTVKTLEDVSAQVTTIVNGFKV